MKHYFFDMDGVLFDSMSKHAQAWEEVMSRHGLNFSARDCYINEGRTGHDVIHEAITTIEHREPTFEEVAAIYDEKKEAFRKKGPIQPVPGIVDVLSYLQSQKADIWIVTGSGQQTLFNELNNMFPGVFTRDHMVTALDVVHGKPNPEPYIKAWEKSGGEKADCMVIENAPLGIRSAKGAGLFTVGVNTGVLTNEDLYAEHADMVFNNMFELLRWLQGNNQETVK